MIASGIAHAWPHEVVDALALFDQGDLIERPPVFWSTRPEYGLLDPSRAMNAEEPPGEETVIDLDMADRPPYGIITSQGCDVADATSKPWIQVAPVYAAEDLEGGAQQLADARGNRVPHLVVIDPPAVDGTWVVDLRLEVPLEKSMLVGRHPIAGFPDDAARRDFAWRLAGRLERGSLPDEVHRSIVRPLKRVLDKANTRLREILADAAIEFRLAVASKDGRHTCQLILVARDGDMPQVTEAQFEDLWDRLRHDADPNVILLPFRFATSDDLSMRDYLSSVLLDDRYLESDAVA